MNWAKENKFLAVYAVVMLIGIGVLGFEVYSASSAYDEANERYTAKASSYNNLRRLAPYPNRANLTKFDLQKKEAAEVINAFQAGLAKREFPLENLSGVAFQDMLKKLVTEVQAKAAAQNVSLTKDKFYLGFNRYETAPPDKDASSILGRDLKAITWVVEQLIATPISELKELKRPEIPEEKGKPTVPAKPNIPGPGGNRPGRPDLVKVHTFEVTFNCKQHQLSKFLNTIVSPNAPQFYIIRNIRIANSVPKAPLRADASAPAPPVPTANPPGVLAAVAPAPKSTTIYLVGDESVDVTIHFEIVDFAEPTEVEAAAAK